MPNDTLSRPIVPAAREGHRRAFSDEDKHRIVEEAVLPGASLSAWPRHYGIAARVLFRWKQELAATPVFVAVQITDGAAPSAAAPSASRPVIGFSRRVVNIDQLLSAIGPRLAFTHLGQLGLGPLERQL